MIYGRRKALHRGMEILEVLESLKNQTYPPDLDIDEEEIQVTAWFNNHTAVAKAKKLAGLGRLKKDTGGATMFYENKQKFGKANLIVQFRVEGKLPPSCKVIETEVWHPEEVVAGHYRTRKEIVCK